MIKNWMAAAACAAGVALAASACSSGSSTAAGPPASSAPAQASGAQASSAQASGAQAGSSPSAGRAAAVSVDLKSLSGIDGMALVDGKGRALYLWEADKSSTSTCSGPCAAAWPPLTVSGAPQAGSGVSQSLLGTARRAD